MYQVAVYVAGRWTMPLAAGYTVPSTCRRDADDLADAPRTLINPAFAAEGGWPALAEGNGVVMLSVEIGLVRI